MPGRWASMSSARASVISGACSCGCELSGNGRRGGLGPDYDRVAGVDRDCVTCAGRGGSGDRVPERNVVSEDGEGEHPRCPGLRTGSSSTAVRRRSVRRGLSGRPGPGSTARTPVRRPRRAPNRLHADPIGKRPARGWTRVNLGVCLMRNRDLPGLTSVGRWRLPSPASALPDRR